TRSLIEIRQSLATLTLQPLKDMTPIERDSKVAELSAREQELSRQLSQTTGRPAEARWIELADVRKALPRDGVLVEIVQFDCWRHDHKPGGKGFTGFRHAP